PSQERSLPCGTPPVTRSSARHYRRISLLAACRGLRVRLPPRGATPIGIPELRGRVVATRVEAIRHPACGQGIEIPTNGAVAHMERVEILAQRAEELRPTGGLSGAIDAG